MKIDGNIMVADLLEYDDRCEEVFEKFGLKCNECSGAKTETLDEAAFGHGIDPDSLKREFEKLIEEIEKEKNPENNKK